MRAVCFVLLVSLALGVSANISCYECTSNDNPTCAVNDASSLEAFKKVCQPIKEGSLAGTAAIGCRKTTQSIEGVVSTVRECAYSGTEVDGLKKTGNHGIHLYFYQCENDRADVPCNSIGSVFSPVALLTIIFFYLVQ